MPALALFTITAASAWLLHGRLQSDLRVWPAIATFVGASILAFSCWVTFGLMMAFACDAARPNELLERAFRIVDSWRFVGPVVVLALTVAVLAGTSGVPKKAWLLAGATTLAWFGVAIAWLVAGLRT